MTHKLAAREEHLPATIPTVLRARTKIRIVVSRSFNERSPINC